MLKRRLEKKFIQTYDTHFEKIFKYCYYRSSDRELAKDLAQQAFMKTWAALQSGSDIDNIRAFVYATAHNLVIDWYRRKREISLEILEENGFDPPDLTQDPEQDAEFSSLLSILEELSQDDKELVLLRHVEGVKPREIARMLGTDANTISVRIHRATHRLREILKKKLI